MLLIISMFSLLCYVSRFVKMPYAPEELLSSNSETVLTIDDCLVFE